MDRWTVGQVDSMRGCPSVHLSICPSVHLSICPSVHLSIYLASMPLDDLIRRAQGNDPAARDELFTLLYSELHRLAERHLRRGGGGLTLGATTLVHEAWLSMAGAGADYPDQARFFGYASRA